MAHLVFARYGITSEVVNGTIDGGRGGHAWLRIVASGNEEDSLIVDSNYVRGVLKYSDYKNKTNFVNEIGRQTLVEIPKGPLMFLPMKAPVRALQGVNQCLALKTAQLPEWFVILPFGSTSL